MKVLWVALLLLLLLVVGVFVGFDDNRSLGNGETGTTAAVPIFTEFMMEAAKDWPKDEFKAPKNAKYATVRGIREAFRPGTEPQMRVQAAPVAGPQPYNQVWPQGQVTGAPAPPPPPPKKQDDMTGLY